MSRVIRYVGYASDGEAITVVEVKKRPETTLEERRAAARARVIATPKVVSYAVEDGRSSR